MQAADSLASIRAQARDMQWKGMLLVQMDTESQTPLVRHCCFNMPQRYSDFFPAPACYLLPDSLPGLLTAALGQ